MYTLFERESEKEEGHLKVRLTNWGTNFEVRDRLQKKMLILKRRESHRQREIQMLRNLWAKGSVNSC